MNSGSTENKPEEKSTAQKLNPHLESGDDEEEAKQKLQSKKKASKKVASEKTLKSEESLKLTKKGQKRKRGAIKKDKQPDNVDTNLDESANEETDSVPSSRNKQLKAQIDDPDSQQKEKSIELGNKGEMQAKDKPIVQVKGESNVQGTNNLAIPCNSSADGIVDQDILLTCQEGSSVNTENNTETDTSNLNPSGETANEASSQNEERTRTVDVDNVPLNEVADETPGIHSDDDEIISNSESRNQLVESSTDKMLLSDACTSIDEIRGDGNCSSSGDTVYPRSRNVVSSDICQSSDSLNILKTSHKHISKIEDNGASSSTCQQSNNNSPGKEDNTKEQVDSENSPHSKSVQTETIKTTGCEVSQSLDDENKSSIAYSEVKDTNECETSVSPQSPAGQVSSDLDVERGIYNAGEGSSNVIDVSHIDAEGTEQTKRKLSSCEVTQSNSSEREFPGTPDEASECEVFTQNPLPGIENVFNRSSSPLRLVAGSSDEAGCSRHSLASESSTSEVSQSHRSVIQESRSTEERYLSNLPFSDGAVCSQSSDQVTEHLSEATTENKDLCVSSCDISKDESVQEESIESNQTTRNAGCEVSQSDKTDANTSSENAEDETLVSNECDALSQGRDIISPRIGMLNTPPEDTGAATSSRRQMACEVTQSFSSTNNDSGSEINLRMNDKPGSSECDNFEDSGPSSRGLNDDLNNNCVSSDDVVHFLPPREDVEEQEKDPLCEVSQSFRSGNDVSLEDPCGSSGLTSSRAKTKGSANEEESKNSCEVTQSLELESSSVSELYEDEDDSINECERSNSNLDVDQSDMDAVDQSDDYIEEICESSDDIIVVSNDESNSQPEQVRPVSYSGCEVSQSYRLDDGNLITQAEQSFDVGVESSNECEVYASSVSSALEYNINCSDSDEKNICESSDDIERSSDDFKYSSRHSKSDSQEACQSTKCDGIFSDESEKVECTGNNSNEYNAENEVRDLTDDGINVCESSEDVNIIDHSPEPNSGACSSSDKLFKKPTDSNNKRCDSVSSQEIPGPSTEISLSEIEGNQISQSETGTNIVSSDASQSDSVKVSSSVDSISSNFVDVIYSSSNVSNSTVSSNSEVSQSSVRKGPYVWSGNLLSGPSSSNSGVGIVADVSSEQQSATSFSGESNVQSTANDSISEREASDPISLSDASTSSSRNNVIESSISSSSASGNRIKKHILKVKKSYDVSAENLSTSQSTSATKEQNRESVILGGNCSNKPDLPENSSPQNQPEVDSMSQQLAVQNDPRPSLLEVMVSSASDFRNSLLYDSISFGMETNISSVVESSGNSVRPTNEFSEVHVTGDTEDLSGISKDATLKAIAPQNLVENSDSSRAEVSGSTEREEIYISPSGSRQQVSQSSDIVNTHSSTSQIPASDDISESLRPDLVQSSSQVRKTSDRSTKAVSTLTTASETKSSSVSDNVKIIESPESSSTKISMPSCSGNSSASSENSAQSIESSRELLSSFSRSSNVDSEVSSTPSNVHNSNAQILSMDGSDQCSFIEGNLVILPGSDTILNRQEVSLIQVGGSSSRGNFMQFQDDEQLLLQTSNEADTLNSSLVFSSSAMQMPLREEIGCLTENVLAENAYGFEPVPRISTTPADEVIAIVEDVDHSSEVSESLASDQNELSQSVLADSNVSCSIVEFSLNETFDKKYSFNEGEFPGTSREAESKSDDGISSYQSVCDDNILPVPNLSSSANTELSMYSHIGEFEDSIQSSSLDATHFSINEQIKAISSPPTFSNSESSEDQVPTSINAFVSFSSESHNLPSLQYSLPSISNIPPSFMAEGMSSRLQTEAILDDKSLLIGDGAADIASRSTVVQSSNSMYTQEEASMLSTVVSETGSHGTDDSVDESSRISGLEGTDNSPEEYEVLSEYEEIENAVDDSDLIDSSND